MRQLEKLIIDAQIITEPEAEVERVMQVCNACRYCEGFCAVFPAMTQRLEFGKADINYLANLCHNCGACLHACQYAPPHEFAINVPKAMAEVRLETYQHYAQPVAFGALYRRAGVTVTLALVFGLILFLLLAMGLKGSLLHPPLAGDFYQIFPHNLLAWMFGSGYHYFAGIEAPYPFFSVPVMLGTLGGIGLVVGPAGLLWLNLKRSPLHGDARQKPMDRGFILLLLLTSLTGLALLAGRDSSWMAILLAIHLGVVMALFLTIPYGKFAHGFYRCAALLKWAIEKRRGKQAGVTDN